MGFFSSLKENACKAKAATVVQNVLEHLDRNGIYPADEAKPAKFANLLIEIAWDKKLELSGQGTYPHHLCLAAASLAMMSEGASTNGNRDRANLTTLALSLLVQEYERTKYDLKLDSYDTFLMEKAAQQLIQSAGQVDDSLSTGIF